MGGREVARPGRSIAEDASGILDVVVAVNYASIVIAVAEAAAARASGGSLERGVEVVSLGEADAGCCCWLWDAAGDAKAGCVWVHRTGLQEDGDGEEASKSGKQAGG